MLAAGQAGCTYIFLLFRLRKSQSRGSSFVRPVAYTCFRFSACKNWNAGAAVPAAGVLAAGAFLSHTSLAIFAFSLVKIVRRGQQVQVCQQVCQQHMC